MKDDERTRRRRRTKRRPRRRKGLQLVVMLLLLLLCRWTRVRCRTDYHGVKDSYGMMRGRGRDSSTQWNTWRTPLKTVC